MLLSLPFDVLLFVVGLLSFEDRCRLRACSKALLQASTHNWTKWFTCGGQKLSLRFDEAQAGHALTWLAGAVRRKADGWCDKTERAMKLTKQGARVFDFTVLELHMQALLMRHKYPAQLLTHALVHMARTTLRNLHVVVHIDKGAQCCVWLPSGMTSLEKLHVTLIGGAAVDDKQTFRCAGAWGWHVGLV